MKKFKLISIISSIFGVFSIALGCAIGLIGKPKTIDSVSAVDLPTEQVLSNTFVCSEPLSYFSGSKVTGIGLGYEFDLIFSVYCYVNSNRGYDYYLGNFRVNSFTAFVLTNGSPTFVFNTHSFYTNDLSFIYVGNYSSDTGLRADGSLMDLEFVLNGVINPSSTVITVGLSFSFGGEDSLSSIYRINRVDRVYFGDVAGRINGTVLSIDSYYHQVSQASADFYNIGFNDGKNDVLTDLSSYNLYTAQQYADYGSIQYDNGVDNVLNNLSDYSLYNYQQYSDYGVTEFNAGVAYATDNDLNLYNYLRTLFHAPVDIFKGVWNWSLPLGNGSSIDLLPLMTFLLTIAIALAIVKLILGGK